MQDNGKLNHVNDLNYGKTFECKMGIETYLKCLIFYVVLEGFMLNILNEIRKVHLQILLVTKPKNQKLHFKILFYMTCVKMHLSKPHMLKLTEAKHLHK